MAKNKMARWPPAGRLALIRPTILYITGAALSSARTRSSKRCSAASFIPVNEMEAVGFKPLAEQELRHPCSSVESQTLGSGGAAYKPMTHHGREYQLEVRETGLICIQGQSICGAPTKKPMFGHDQTCGDNTWRYEGAFFIGREPRNAKLLKAALPALSGRGFSHTYSGRVKRSGFFFDNGHGEPEAMC